MYSAVCVIGFLYSSLLTPSSAMPSATFERRPFPLIKSPLVGASTIQCNVPVNRTYPNALNAPMVNCGQVINRFALSIQDFGDNAPTLQGGLGAWYFQSSTNNGTSKPTPSYGPFDDVYTSNTLAPNDGSSCAMAFTCPPGTQVSHVVETLQDLNSNADCDGEVATSINIDPSQFIEATQFLKADFIPAKSSCAYWMMEWTLYADIVAAWSQGVAAFNSTTKPEAAAAELAAAAVNLFFPALGTENNPMIDN